ncbi:hypothetical protein ABT120_55565 [Nonomuraea angiospora]|uniref:trypsin-like serine peptidase n=1 Tax=Nonomuraea angiospora TaxID=46172 RepID=UPI003318DB96
MKRNLLPTGGALLAAALLVPVLALPAHADNDLKTIDLASTSAQAMEVTKFWTRIKLARAQPSRLDPGDGGVKLVEGGGYSPDGKPGLVPATGHGTTTTAKSKNVNLPRTIGKVFYETNDGSIGFCSASSITSRYGNTIATAGQCVYDVAANAPMKNVIFVPGYYQGKTPWGIYVAKTAYTHYDFSTFEDFDRDYAFVTVYNGVGLSEKQVTKATYDAYAGQKFIDEKDITAAEYAAGYDKYGSAGPYKAAALDPKVETVARPADAEAKIEEYIATGIDGVKLVGAEVTKSIYEAAPTGLDDNARYERLSQKVAISEEGYNQLKATSGFLGELTEVKKDGVVIGWYKQQFYVKKWVKTTAQTRYFVETYRVVGTTDKGSLASNVGAQGFAWNQKPGKPVFIFGYTQGTHPDSYVPYNGITPKWCYGTPSGNVAAIPALKIEEDIVLRCSMNAGSSGAPWLLKYKNATRFGYVNGVTSFGASGVNVSSYFDGETNMVYRAAFNQWSGKIA